MNSVGVASLLSSLATPNELLNTRFPATSQNLPCSAASSTETETLLNTVKYHSSVGIM